MRNSEWFYERGFGIFVHLLASDVNNPNSHRSYGKQTSWDECLNEFDCEVFAEEVKQTGAGYVILTVMQVTKYMLAPNETFNRVTGYKNGEACPSFDFIERIYESLHKRDIDLMLYFTGDGPANDEIAGNAFGYRGFHPNGTKVTKEFVEKWSAVLREYSLRYGKKVKGWWLDGTPGIIGYDDMELLSILTDAARAGNPDAICACNHFGVLGDYGVVRKQVLCGTPCCDYTAGEMVYFEDVPAAPFIGEQRWHILTHLGKSKTMYEYSGWGCEGTRYSAEYMQDYYRKVHAHGGVISVDVCVYRDGHIDPEQIVVLSQMKK